MGEPIEPIEATEAPRRAMPGQRRSPLKIALVTLLVTVLCLLGGGYAYINWQLGAIKRSGELNPGEYENRPSADASLNFLIIGNDEKPEDVSSGRADSLTVVHLTPAKDAVYLISIPRGVLVQLPSGPNRINASFQEGGAKGTTQTVEKLLGVRIDHVGMVDFAGFMGLTTALGGVTVDNPVESSSAGFHFPKGKITISGKEALAFVRQRKGLPQGDLMRTQRQRLVIKAIMSSMLSKEVLSNPAKLHSVIDQFDEFMTIDEGLNNFTIQGLALGVKVRSGNDIHSLMIPIAEEKFVPNGSGSTVEIPDEAQLAELTKAMRENTVAAYFEKYGKQTGFTKAP